MEAPVEVPPRGVDTGRGTGSVGPEEAGEEEAEVPSVLLTEPSVGARAVVGRTVRFAGVTTCRGGEVRMVADDRWLLGTAPVAGDGSFGLVVTFQSPGVGRTIRVTVSGGDLGCALEVVRALDVQPGAQRGVEYLTDSGGCAYVLESMRLPLADPTLRVVASGRASARTVAGHASDLAGALGTLNAGYFGSSAPVSYARGHLGYESPVGNTNGPRACLAWDVARGEAWVELSHGRPYLGQQQWGPGLFPTASDVVCAGPRLLEGGVDVSAVAVVDERFGSSGISPTGRRPRAAVCVHGDGSLLAVAAQNSSTQACGPNLSELAVLLAQRGCVDAINLDGGGSVALWWGGPPVSYRPGSEDRGVFQVLQAYRVP